MVVLITQLSSCQKLKDMIFGDHHHKVDCRIHTFTQEIVHGEPRVATFYNNSSGNPDSVVFDINAGSAGAQYYYFRYNQHNKLVGYDSYYDRGDDNYFFKHRYAYDNNGRIIMDTVDISQAGRWTTVFELQYDNENRVISEVGRVIISDGEPVPDPESFILSYFYDARGNLESGTQAYDDKVNFLRTSSVLMFTERNFSNNNPVGASGYNAEDLPLGFPGFADFMFPSSHWGLFVRYAPTEITYDCD